MARSTPDITVEVVYAIADRQTLVTLVLPLGATVRDAVVQSELPLAYPDIVVVRGKVGIFGKRVAPDTVLKSGDRVEIYRPLSADPKEARRRRASKRK